MDISIFGFITFVAFFILTEALMRSLTALCLSSSSPTLISLGKTLGTVS